MFSNFIFNINSYNNTYHLKLEAALQVGESAVQKTTLLEIVLKNLIPNNAIINEAISLRYDSEQGLLY
jgi:transcription termination factor NusB